MVKSVDRKEQMRLSWVILGNKCSKLYSKINDIQADMIHVVKILFGYHIRNELEREEAGKPVRLLQ